MHRPTPPLIFMPRDLDLLTPNKWVSRTHSGTFLAASVLRYRAEKNRQANGGINPIPATAFGVGN